MNRQWLLTSRPLDAASPENFSYVETPLPQIGDGDILVRTQYFGFDASQRAWMNDVETYIPPVSLNAPMRSQAVGRVVQSRNPGFAEGDLVEGMMSWSDYAVIPADSWYAPRKLPDLGAPLSWYLGVLGVSGLTAYFGITKIARLRPGATILISAATGSNGSLAGPIARQCGAGLVIGLAGGAEKARWLVESQGFDRAIDYRGRSLREQILECAPNGLDCYLDNVGGETLDEMLLHMRRFGSIVMCGGMSAGYGAELPPGPRNVFTLISRSLRMQGYLFTDFADRFDEATQQLLGWIKDGKLNVAEEVVEGFSQLPLNLPKLFSGKNPGKLVLKNDGM
jgi:NADPH-dependent curcumin reductase CurA